MQIKQDAIFIADAHFNFKREDLETLLKKIVEEKMVCSQLFLMGDMFDFIAYEVNYFKKINKNIIELINKISTKLEVFYFEGNHDFNLKQLFPNTKVFSRASQPVKMNLEEKTVALSHGDIFVGEAYEMFCKVIRNSFTLKFLNTIDIFSFISKKVETKLANKKICHKIENFESIIKNKIVQYNADIVIEGHYHQGKHYSFDKQEYINIPSFACEKKYVRYKGKQFNQEN